MSNFFVVEPQSPEDILEMFDILKHYQIQHYTMPVENKQPVLVVMEAVHEDEGGVGSLGLAEMAFQMNFKQVGVLCPVCKEEGVSGCCGHLTFNNMI